MLYISKSYNLKLQSFSIKNCDQSHRATSRKDVIKKIRKKVGFDVTRFFTVKESFMKRLFTGSESKGV